MRAGAIVDRLEASTMIEVSMIKSNIMPMAIKFRAKDDRGRKR